MIKDIKDFNRNLKDLIEVVRDLNILLSSVLGYKVTYKKDKENK